METDRTENQRNARGGRGINTTVNIRLRIRENVGLVSTERRIRHKLVMLLIESNALPQSRWAKLREFRYVVACRLDFRMGVQVSNACLSNSLRSIDGIVTD